MSRARKIAIGAFVALLAATPFIPRGSDSDSAIRPSGEREFVEPGAPGPGTLTPAMRREIDRVVAAGQRVGAVSARQTPSQLASNLVRCADFEGQRYCLHTGWTSSSEAAVRTGVAATAALSTRRAGEVETTGDLDLADTLRREAALSPTERAAGERAELTAAARSVAKVWMLRHEIQGTPLPAGFSKRHPEAGLTTTSSTTSTRSTTSTKTAADYPRVGRVLKPKRTAEQERTYWCGPTTMQMITWGWQGERKPQGHWANRLGTTTSGTAITDMVHVVNEATGYDRERRAGTYITLDISDWSFGQWALLNMRHIVDYRAPLVLHPILLKKYYPYLDDDASGHFQVGRGFDQNPGGRPKLGYFEPWDQSKFDPSEPRIARTQWQNAYKSYRANEAHFQHNIGV